MKEKALFAALCLSISLAASRMTAYAQTVQLEDGTVFDSDYYAENNPDLKAVYGTDFNALLNHYQTYGIEEGRSPSGEGTTADVTMEEISSLVTVGSLENLASLKKKCTDAEFQEAYNAASEIVAPLVGMSREDQLMKIAVALRLMFEKGEVTYSTNDAHYNDPYGYFVAGVASCAGCTRATGLCLNMLGISYEHVNENQWAHQWCRVNVDGTYWICDAYGLYVGPEPAPYTHPYLQ